MSIILEKRNFFVFTGGPGAGKSTLLNALGAKGFSCVAETGREIIKERKVKMLPPRPDPVDFAVEMFQRDYDNFIRNIQKSEVMFFDRSFLDSAALLYQADKVRYAEIAEILEKHRFNRKVFIAPPWKEIYQNDAERDQTFEASQLVYQQMYDWYVLNRYDPVILPFVSIEERVLFVLNAVRNNG